MIRSGQRSLRQKRTTAPKSIAWERLGSHMRNWIQHCDRTPLGDGNMRGSTELRGFLQKQNCSFVRLSHATIARHKCSDSTSGRFTKMFSLRYGLESLEDRKGSLKNYFCASNTKIEMSSRISVAHLNVTKVRSDASWQPFVSCLQNNLVIPTSHWSSYSTTCHCSIQAMTVGISSVQTKQKWTIQSCRRIPRNCTSSLPFGPYLRSGIWFSRSGERSNHIVSAEAEGVEDTHRIICWNIFALFTPATIRLNQKMINYAQRRFQVEEKLPVLGVQRFAVPRDLDG